MNKLIFGLFLLFPAVIFSQGKVDFNKYFADSTLRVDYYHTGDAREEIVSMDKMYIQPGWAGNPGNCIQPFELGTYKVSLFDVATEKLIYSKGYSTIFGEYQTIDAAIKGIKKTYHETVLVPFPLKEVKMVIEKRAKNNSLSPIYSVIIDPKDYHICRENPARSSDEVISVIKNGNPHNSVDLVILGEGYTISEKDKFIKDLNYFTNLFFTFEPYKSHHKAFNISGIFAPSENSGTDEPRQGVYRNTRFGSSFNTFDTDRYCLADDEKNIRDAAGMVPYDAILIMVNKDRYGGGGIYNWQTIFATGSDKRDYVFLHEFGHAFAGLADEYYSSEVAYQDIFTPGVEPLEANITALLDTANVKWKKYLTPGIMVPTEWGKATFDSLNNALNSLSSEKMKTIVQLKNQKAPMMEIESREMDFDRRLNDLRKQADDFLFNHPLKDKVGVFEGANYLSEGYYRPTINSMMHKFDINDKSYGVVNNQAIIAIIEYYTGK
ncbi:MAG: peptidase M64 [Bacteroidales bacterium]|nr:peptidase M64 [Bacteroidales bacterium]